MGSLRLPDTGPVYLDANGFIYSVERLREIFRALLFESLEVRLVPTTRAIWESAAELRARHNFKTPDAIHAASALAVGSTLFVTNDPHFRRLSQLPIVIMSEAVQAPLEG